MHIIKTRLGVMEWKGEFAINEPRQQAFWFVYLFNAL